MTATHTITITFKVRAAGQDAAEDAAGRIARHVQSAHGDVIVAGVDAVASYPVRPYDHEERCHCGGAYRSSDHCPICGCEQYESRDCGFEAVQKGATVAQGHRIGMVTGVNHARNRVAVIWEDGNASIRAVSDVRVMQQAASR